MAGVARRRGMGCQMMVDGWLRYIDDGGCGGMGNGGGMPKEDGCGGMQNSGGCQATVDVGHAK